MIVTYCPQCKGQYTALDINIYGESKLSSACSKCGYRFKKVVNDGKWARLFRPSYVNKYWDDIKILYEVSFLPYMEDKAFDTAFRGYLSWHKRNLILRTSLSFKKDGVPYYHIGHFGAYAFGPLIQPTKSRLCYMGETIEPEILYVTNRVWDAVNIRYMLTLVEGEAPPVLLHTVNDFSRKAVSTRSVVNPKRTILIGNRIFMDSWTKTNGAPNVSFLGDMGSSVYQVIRALTDTAMQNEISILDNEDVGRILNNTGSIFIPKRASYKKEIISKLYRSPAVITRFKEILPANAI